MCTLEAGSFDCTLPSDMEALFTKAGFIGVDEFDNGEEQVTLTRGATIGGELTSATRGSITIGLSVECEGDCPPSVSLGELGTVNLPCSSSVTGDLLSPEDPEYVEPTEETTTSTTPMAFMWKAISLS